jgi:hypothetical protein
VGDTGGAPEGEGAGGFVSGGFAPGSVAFGCAGAFADDGGAADGSLAVDGGVDPDRVIIQPANATIATAAMPPIIIGLRDGGAAPSPEASVCGAATAAAFAVC